MNMIFAEKHGRNIPKEDKIFGISNRAQAAAAEYGKENVVNGTIGALMSDEGELIVLSSVDRVMRALKPADYAAYAPIGGIPSFREAVKKAALGKYEPKGYVEAVATPGGTGALRTAVANYTSPGDAVLTHDWFWSPYGTICQEQGRKIETFEFFNKDRAFNTESFACEIRRILEKQDRLLIILNTPAHNPTGYSLTEGDWKEVCGVLGTVRDKKITLLVDAAYIDFAGDEEEYRKFLPYLEELNGNVLPLVAYSLSKTYTIYGMRCGALMCISKESDIAEEFRCACEFSCRGTWSNCSRAPQVVLSEIYSDPALLEEVGKERKEYRDMLLRRGRAFEKAAEEAGLEIVPFDAGFFVSIPCKEPDRLAAMLEEENIFIVPLAKGVRVSVASVKEEICRMLPAKIKAAMDRM